MSDDDRFTTEWIPTKVLDTNDAQDFGHVGDVETTLRCINRLAAEIERLTARVERLEIRQRSPDESPRRTHAT